MTAAAFQSLGISDDTKEWLNRLVIGVATILLIILEREGPDCQAQLICRDSDFAALSEHQLLAGVGVARWKAWPAVEKCLLK